MTFRDDYVAKKIVIISILALLGSICQTRKESLFRNQEAFEAIIERLFLLK